MNDDPDTDIDGLSIDWTGLNVSQMERAGEAVGQMETGSKSSLLWCPGCDESNCLTAICEDGQITEYDCCRCGKTIGANEI